MVDTLNPKKVLAELECCLEKWWKKNKHVGCQILINELHFGCQLSMFCGSASQHNACKPTVLILMIVDILTIQ